MSDFCRLLLVAAALCAFSSFADVFSPAYFWCWNARLDADALCAQLEDMHAHGIRNVCIHPVPKNFRKDIYSEMEPEYLTPGYLEVYAKVVRRAGELGMHSYLYDEGGWPSGGACGLVAASDPEGRFAPRDAVIAQDGGAAIVKRESYGPRSAKHPSLVEKGVADRFIGITHEAYAKALGRCVGTTVRIAFTDEPDMPRDAKGVSLGWASDFADEFKRRKGYDVMPLVPDLIHDADGTNAALAEVRVDVQDVKADLYVERYLSPIREWCHAHGLLSGGHLNNEDEPEAEAERGHGSLLRSLRAMDVPGVDVIWRQLFPASDAPATLNPFPRYAASAMHQNGGRLALSESFAVFGDSTSPAQMKWVVDYQMVRGINTFVFSSIWQRTGDSEPHSGPVVPHWDFEPHFFRYVERTCRFLSRGRPGAEIAVLCNARGFWAGGEDRKTAAAAHYAAARALDEMNCDYDFVEDVQLADASVLPDGGLQVGAMVYKAVVLPSSNRMLASAGSVLKAFEKAGGLVVRGVDAIGTVPRTLRVSGRGARSIRVMKRIDGDRRIWFLMNEDMEDRSVEMSFPDGGAVVRYDPEGEAFELAAADGRVVRTFLPGETAIYVTGSVPDSRPPPRYEGRRRVVDSGWTLRALVSHEVGDAEFKVRRLDAAAEPTALGDWRAVLGRTFSGKVEYRVAFDSDAAGDCLLDLGDVKWCASARLNGKDLGERFFGPFAWPAEIRKGRNVLEVTVANLLVNQVGDDAIRGRLLRASRSGGKYEERVRPFDRFNHESGLFGPVTLRMKHAGDEAEPLHK